MVPSYMNPFDAMGCAMAVQIVGNSPHQLLETEVKALDFDKALQYQMKKAGPELSMVKLFGTPLTEKKSPQTRKSGDK